MAVNENSPCCVLSDTGNDTITMEQGNHFSLSKESIILLLICGLDLLSTCWLISTGRAVEGNTVMSFYLYKSWVLLVAAKLTLSVLPVFILEWCRRYRPRFVHKMLRLTIATYLGLYLVSFAYNYVSLTKHNTFLNDEVGTIWSERVEFVAASSCWTNDRGE